MAKFTGKVEESDTWGGGGGCARRGRKVIQKKGKRRVIRYGGKKRWALLRELDLKSTELRTETACKVTV